MTKIKKYKSESDLIIDDLKKDYLNIDKGIKDKLGHTHYKVEYLKFLQITRKIFEGDFEGIRKTNENISLYNEIYEHCKNYDNTTKDILIDVIDYSGHNLKGLRSVIIEIGDIIDFRIKELRK